jgi:hypothetical protein
MPELLSSSWHICWDSACHSALKKNTIFYNI